MGADPHYDIEYVGFVTGEGGDALQMLQLAHGMQQLGRNVRIVVPATPATVGFAKRARERGLVCERSQLLRVDEAGPRQNIFSMIALARSLTAPVVHFHTGNSCLPRSLLLAVALTFSGRFFVTVHSPYETIPASSGRARWWARASRLLLHAVISPSDHGSAFQRRCGIPASKVLTIRNAVDTHVSIAGDASVREELNVSPDTPLVVFTSRIVKQKRPWDAVRIFAAVADEFPDAQLVFVGSGTHTEMVQQLATSLDLSERVKMVGFRTDVAHWLAASTVWLLPTERENFSIALLEALAAGCAVLTTLCPGNDEVIVDNKNALTFPIGDIDEAASKLRCLLHTPDLRSKLRAAAHESAQDFSVDAMVRSYADAYEQFVSQ